MKYSTVGDCEISRFGMGTKRMPTTDKSRVVRLDVDAAKEIAAALTGAGGNFFDTSYSDHKGESEAFLGEYLAENTGKRLYVATSFFEMVDPRFDYVFQKQLKKLGTDCIDFYYIEGVSDMNRMKDIDSGAVDFFFEQKEAGKIKHLGFSSEMKAENLKLHLDERPWDFVRMKVNYYDWYLRGVRESYEVASEAGIPIFAHAPLRAGITPNLKPAAFEVLKQHGSKYTSIEWALRFVNTLQNLTTITCNMYSPKEVEENAAVFESDATLTDEEFAYLEQVAQAQRPGKHK